MSACGVLDVFVSSSTAALAPALLTICAEATRTSVFVCAIRVTFAYAVDARAASRSARSPAQCFRSRSTRSRRRRRRVRRRPHPNTPAMYSRVCSWRGPQRSVRFARIDQVAEVHERDSVGDRRACWRLWVRSRSRGPCGAGGSDPRSPPSSADRAPSTARPSAGSRAGARSRARCRDAAAGRRRAAGRSDRGRCDLLVEAGALQRVVDGGSSSRRPGRRGDCSEARTRRCRRSTSGRGWAAGRPSKRGRAARCRSSSWCRPRRVGSSVWLGSASARSAG